MDLTKGVYAASKQSKLYLMLSRMSHGEAYLIWRKSNDTLIVAINRYA